MTESTHTAALADTTRPPLQILIVDDHAIVRRACRDILISELGNVAIREAEDTSSALESLRGQPFDLVILDINLPGRSGLDVLEETRALYPKTPILVLSTYPEEEFAVRAFKLGAAGYVNKQSAVDELVAAAKKVLSGGKYVSAAMAEKCAAALGGAPVIAAHEILSNRELQVLQWVARGKTLREIAQELSLSEKTIATYRGRISQKMGLSTNVELTRYALQHRLVE